MYNSEATEFLYGYRLTEYEIKEARKGNFIYNREISDITYSWTDSNDDILRNLFLSQVELCKYAKTDKDLYDVYTRTTFDLAKHIENVIRNFNPYETEKLINLNRIYRLVCRKCIKYNNQRNMFFMYNTKFNKLTKKSYSECLKLLRSHQQTSSFMIDGYSVLKNIPHQLINFITNDLRPYLHKRFPKVKNPKPKKHF
jgi:hypothetical protein